MSTLIDTLKPQLKEYVAAPLGDKKHFIRYILAPFVHLMEDPDRTGTSGYIEETDVITLIEAALSTGEDIGKNMESIRAHIAKAQDDSEWGL